MSHSKMWLTQAKVSGFKLNTTKLISIVYSSYISKISVYSFLGYGKDNINYISNWHLIYILSNRAVSTNAVTIIAIKYRFLQLVP